MSEGAATCHRGAALVVGGAGGLGAAVARKLAEQGVSVAITFRADARRAESLAGELERGGVQALTLRLDLTDDDDGIETALAAAERAFGSIATVVYAAGIPIPQAYVGQAKQADWRKVVDMDLHGFFRLVQAVLPALRRSRGSIVAVTTAAAQRHIPRDILSSAPKAAVEALVRGLAREEGRFGVRANCVAPGLIEAGISVELLSEVIAPMVVEKIRQDIALKRFGTAEEVAEAVAFLASDRARYITGQVLSVDGGWLR